MKNIRFFAFILSIVSSSSLRAQQVIPDLTAIADSTIWLVYNRIATPDKSKGVYLDEKKGDGIAFLKNKSFGNVTIEADLKGKNIQGQSFVGILFHGLTEKVYDAVYFRPFNFKNPERKDFCIQYISHPQNTWFFLRDNFPGKYESSINPILDPDEWFHVKIVINYPSVSVFVNNNSKPSLEVTQLSTQKSGTVGFYVANGSDGAFKNLKIAPSK